MHNAGYKSALVRRACRYSDARPPRKTDGFLLESEIPPHMRGKAKMICDTARRVGITPAYAGKSSGLMPRCGTNGDHPRICGEKLGVGLILILIGGSPPHMRGKVMMEILEKLDARITPAYAGVIPYRQACPAPAAAPRCPPPGWRPPLFRP